MNDSRPVQFSPDGPSNTVLPAEPPEPVVTVAGSVRSRNRAEPIEVCVTWPIWTMRTSKALTLPAWLKQLIVDDPRSCAALAALGESTDDEVEAYSYFRVGYHRGLDALRANGWRGSGFVRWGNESNRGFLSALSGLARTAAAIGETDEAERCELFLRQCDPSWPPAELRDGL